MSLDLTAYCETCNKPVAPGAGSLYVLYREINATSEARGEVPDAPALNWEQLFSLPVAPAWHLRHDACESQAAEGSYEIAVEDIGSWPKLVEWTAHLLEKRWLPSTNWAAVLGSIVRGESGPLRAALEPSRSAG